MLLLFWSGWVWITCEGQLRLTTETMSDARHESQTHTQLVGEGEKKEQDNLRSKCMSDQSLFQSVLWSLVIQERRIVPTVIISDKVEEEGWRMKVTFSWFIRWTRMHEKDFLSLLSPGFNGVFDATKKKKRLRNFGSSFECKLLSLLI